MTSSEQKIEHRHIYETRLGCLGIDGEPPAWAHNMAVIEADAHMADLRRATEDDTARRLRELREGL